MAVARRTTGGTSTFSGSSTAPSTPKPANLADGDLLVASLAQNGGSVTSVPSGWFTEVDMVSGTNPRHSVYTRYVANAASEPASYTWGLSSSIQWTLQITAYTGHNVTSNGASAFDAFGADNSAGVTATAAVAPSISPTVANTMLVGGASGNSSTTTWTGPAAMTEIYDPGTAKAHCYYSDETLAASGATGTRTFTQSAARAWTAWIGAIAPATGGGNTPQASSETGTLSDTEASTLAATATSTETGSLSTSSNASTAIATATSSETGSLATSSNASTGSATATSAETGTISASESSIVAIQQASAETGTISATEVSTIALTVPSAETGTMSDTESDTLAATATSSETGTVTATHASTAAGAATSGETGTISVSEADITLVKITTADTGTIAVTEVSNLTVTASGPISVFTSGTPVIVTAFTSDEARIVTAYTSQMPVVATAFTSDDAIVVPAYGSQFAQVVEALTSDLVEVIS